MPLHDLRKTGLIGRSESVCDEKFPQIPKEQLFDSVCQMYHDCHSDVEIAQELSRERGIAVTADTVRRIRVEAAFAADESGDRETRRKWIFRFDTPSEHNLAKEYMFLAGIPSLLKAKIELAMKIDELQKTASEQDLWISTNELLGRNNIPVEQIQSLLAFYHAHERIKRNLTSSSWKYEVSDYDTRLRLFVQVVHAHDVEAGRNSQKVISVCASILGMQEDALTEGDVVFLRDCYNCAKTPDHRGGRESLLAVLLPTDMVDLKRVRLSKALHDNAGNLSLEEVNKLVEDMRSGSLLPGGQLSEMLEAVRRRTRQVEIDRQAFSAFGELLTEHILITDASRFCSKWELIVFTVRGFPKRSVQKMLDDLNAMADYQTVHNNLKQMLGGRSPHSPQAVVGVRYCKLRFGRIFKLR